jgi:hypothetical protein
MRGEMTLQGHCGEFNDDLDERPDIYTKKNAAISLTKSLEMRRKISGLQRLDS